MSAEKKSETLPFTPGSTTPTTTATVTLITPSSDALGEEGNDPDQKGSIARDREIERDVLIEMEKNKGEPLEQSQTTNSSVAGILSTLMLRPQDTDSETSESELKAEEQKMKDEKQINQEELSFKLTTELEKSAPDEKQISALLDQMEAVEISAVYDTYSVGIKALSKALQANSTVRVLKLKGVKSRGIEALISMFEKNCTIQDLRLFYSEVGDEGAEKMFKMLTLNQRLNFLTLYSCDIGPEGAAALVALPTLYGLSLSNNFRIGSEGAREIARELENNQGLNYINLDNCSIGDEGFEALSNALKKNTFIVRFEIDNLLRKENIQFDNIENILKQNKELPSAVFKEVMRVTPLPSEISKTVVSYNWSFFYAPLYKSLGRPRKATENLDGRSDRYNNDSSFILPPGH